MRVLVVLALSLTSFSMISRADEPSTESITAEDRALAESVRDETIKALEVEVEKKDAILRQARRQRSPQMHILSKQLETAKKELAHARRKPLEDYLAESRQPDSTANPTDAQPRRPAEQPTTSPVQTGLSVTLPYTKAYISRGADVLDFALVLASFNGQPPTQGFFQIGDKAERLTATSSDPDLLEIARDTKFTLSPFISRLRKPGKGVVTVSAGRYRAQQGFEIVEVPVNADAPSAEVIEALGLPTTKKPVFVDWPNTKMVDCFIYSPEAGNSFVGEHWTYEQYPGMMLSISKGKLYRVGTLKVDNATRAGIVIPEPNIDADTVPATQ